MFNRIEIIGFGAMLLLIAVALYLVRIDTNLVTFNGDPAAQVATANQAVDNGVIVVEEGGDQRQNTAAALAQAVTADGQITELVIDDVKIGTGPQVEAGDTVRVHYVGRLRTGEEFDNSRKRGTPFTFTLGEGRVIAGWEQGVQGMQVGGERILVIPPTLAYGSQTVGPIPANSTLVFAIELLEIVE